MIIGSFCKATLVATIAALWLTGCASRVHSPYVPGPYVPGPYVPSPYAPGPYAPGLESPRLIPAAVSASRFNYKRTSASPIFHDDGETENYWIESLTWPSVGENGQDGNLVSTRYYRSKGHGAKPLVIVLPIWGKYTYPPNQVASEVMERSGGTIDVLQVLGENTLFDWEGTAQAGSGAEFVSEMYRMVGRMINSVIDIRRIVDWAQLQPGIDPDRIGLVGFSMSAVAGSITLAHEPRLSAGVFVMGGAEPHDALSVCNGRLGFMREAITKRFGWTVEQYRDNLEAPLAPIDPARYPGQVDPSRVLIIEAAHDTCLPEPGRSQFWQAMGRPERISYLYDHKMAFMSMTFLGGGSLQKEVYHFLEKALLPEGPPGGPKPRYEVERPDEVFADD